MIVVTGATGQLGRLVIAALIKKVPASGIVAAVRNVEKAKDIAAVGVQVRYADYNQPPTWEIVEDLEAALEQFREIATDLDTK